MKKTGLFSVKGVFFRGAAAAALAAVVFSPGCVSEDHTQEDGAEARDFEGYERVGRVDFEVRADGDLSEWENRPYILLDSEENVFPVESRGYWRGPGDLSVKIYTGWDKENFYIAAEVTDDVHFNFQFGDRLWDGDSLQFAIAVSDEAEPFNAGIALASGRVETYLWRGPETDLFGKSDYTVKVDEAEGKIFYEVIIPFEVLGVEEPRVGGEFGFNAVVFDDDTGAGHDYWMQISPGIAGGWAPEEFKTFVLSD